MVDSASNAAYWTQLDWKSLIVGLTALVGASTPLWLRVIQRKEDKQKLEIDRIATEDKRLARAYDDALKDNEREAAARVVASREGNHYRQEALRLEDIARELQHDLVSISEAYRMLMSRFQRLASNEMTKAEQDAILAAPVQCAVPERIIPTQRFAG